MDLLPLALVLAFIALLMLLVARLLRRRSGLPEGRVVAADTSGWKRLDKPLYAADLGLTGKPDYILQQGSKYIPVEVKTGRTPERPYDSHIYQLAAYCLLVERAYGRRPLHGILHYPGRDFEVPFTRDLETSLLGTLADMHRGECQQEQTRSHNEKNRCCACGYYSSCNQVLK